MKVPNGFGASFSLLLVARVAGAVIGFATQVLLARSLPAQDLGTFYFVTSLAVIAAILAGLGFPGVLVRFQARYRERTRGNLTAGLFSASWRLTLAASVCAAFAVAAYAAFGPALAAPMRAALAVGALSIPAIALSRVVGTFALGYRLFAINFLPDLLLRPAVFLVVLAVALLAGFRFPLLTVIWLLTGLIYIQLLAQTYLLKAQAPALIEPGPSPPRRIVAHWIGAALPLAAVALFTDLFADLAITVTALFLAAHDLAVFAICLKITLLVGFAIQVSYQMSSRDFADAYQSRNQLALGESTSAANAAALATSLAAIVIVFFVGETVLKLFGPDFAGANGLLLALLFSQVVRALGGPAAHLLTLGGHQNLLAASCGICTVALFLFSAGLTPAWGLNGALVAILLTNCIWSGMLAYLVKSRMGMRVDFLSCLSRPDTGPNASVTQP